MKKTRMKIRKSIAALLLAAMTLQSPLAAAAAIADASADTAHQPMVNPGTVPVIDIATANDKGISHNLYSDFSVDKNGIILNNSLQPINTVLAGQIAGNARLKAPATIIINEVTGTNRTNLNGLIEVAGTRADVIIANPNGISGSGFGFINTGRAVLTTGRPQLDKDGSLSGIQVTGGDIAVDGDGLKSENAPDKLDILTGAAKINAQLWAKNDLNVVTGSNLIDYNTLQTRTLPGAADSGVSLDISAVGGMYAGRIMLQGTSKGLGVNVDGQLYSKGDLSISSSGMLSVQGDVAAAGKVSTTAADDVTNAGQISAGGDVTVTSGGMTKNTGYIAAGQAQDDDDETDSPAALPADISVKDQYQLGRYP